MTDRDHASTVRLLAELPFLTGKVPGRGHPPGEALVTYHAELAQYILDHHNKHDQQRALNMNEAQKLARVMKAGDWVEGLRVTWIVFDTNNNLVNGQTTLQAIVMAKAKLKIRTAWGDDPSCIALYDAFRPRSNAYLVGCLGADYASMRAAFGRMRLMFDKGLPMGKPAPTEVIDLTVNDKVANNIIGKCGAVSRQLRTTGIPLSVAAYACWRIAKVHGVEKAWDFMDRTIKGTELKDNDPRLQLVRQFRAGNFNLNGDRKRGVSLIIKAWNILHSRSSAKLRAVAGEPIPDVNP